MHMTAHNGIQVTSVIVIPVPFEIIQIYRIRPQKENNNQTSENKYAVL